MLLKERGCYLFVYSLLKNLPVLALSFPLRRLDVFITYLLRIIRSSSMHKLKLDSANGFIYPMGLIY